MHICASWQMLSISGLCPIKGHKNLCQGIIFTMHSSFFPLNILKGLIKEYRLYNFSIKIIKNFIVGIIFLTANLKSRY